MAWVDMKSNEYPFFTNVKTLSQVSLSSLEAVLLHKRLCIHLRLSQFSTPQPLVVQEKKFVEADSHLISPIKIGISDSDHVSFIPLVLLKQPLMYLSVLLAEDGIGIDFIFSQSTSSGLCNHYGPKI